MVVGSLLLFLSAAAGAALRLATRPTANDLTQAAVRTWNNGEVPRAEMYARLALGRTGELDEARAVLQQVAAHDADPLLQIALLLDVPESSPVSARARYEAGAVALQRGFPSLADRAWTEALQITPGHVAALDGMIGLAAMRLEQEDVLGLTERRSAIASPSLRTVLVLLRCEGFVADAPTIEQQLARFAVSDPTDLPSRLGRARCLIAMGRFADAETLLRSGAKDPRSLILRALIAALRGDLSRGRELLPEEPLEASGEYALALGTIAAAEGDFAVSARALTRGVEVRPLSREIRARLAEVLRRAGRTVEADKHGRAVRILQRIELLALDRETRWNRPTVEEAIALCEAVEADVHARILRLFLEALPSEIAP